MSKKGKIGLIVGIVIMVLALVGGGVAYYMVTKPDTPAKDNRDDNTPVESPEELNYKIDVYKCNYGAYSEKKQSGCTKVAFQIPTSLADAKILTINDNFILYNDNGLRIFNADNMKYQKLNITNDYTNYELNLTADKNKVAGIIYNNKDKNYGYYNIETKKNLYDNKYDYLRALNENYIQGGTELSNGNIKLYALDAKEEKEFLSKDESACSYFYSNNGFILYDSGCIDTYISEIYTKDFKLITDNVDNYYISKNELYNLENDKVRVYNNSGRVLKTHILKDTILDIFDDYYLARNDETIFIRDYEDYEKELGPWKNDMYYHQMISGYYEENTLQNENEKDAGYYFIVQSAGELGGTEYYFNPKTKESKAWDLEEIGGYAKPVLYLYPKEDTKVTVKFAHPEYLTTTYPKFNTNWEVLAKPNGDLYDMSGKYYYGLYWEENSNRVVTFDEGFYVTRDNAIDFLEEKLSLIGLNDRERNEFIMYWLPILEKNKDNLVYFELTEERENFNKLEITPTPDSLLRVAIHVKKASGKVTIKEQNLPTFNRVGFTAVEWGGVLYN